MAPGVLAFIHVINSVQPCSEAPPPPHASPLSAGAGPTPLSPAVVNTATSQQLLFSLAPTSMYHFLEKLFTRRHPLKTQRFHFEHEWAVVQISANRRTHNTGQCDETKPSTEQKGESTKNKRAVKKASIECCGALSSLCDWLYAQCLDKGLLSKLWNIL